METITAPEISNQVEKSPFKLLAAYSEEDKDKFFGRDAETQLLYQSVQEANVVLVYGESGTGKTSLVQCGLINETKHFNWTSITVRRGEDITVSLFERLKDHIDSDYLNVNKDSGVTDLVQEVFMNNFQPILLIFDQFEELFTFGNEAERARFLDNIAEIFKLRIPWKMVFVMREEFIARLTEFENKLPNLFKKRLRIELMNNIKCREVITKSCHRFGITLLPLRQDNSTSTDTPEKIIKAVSNSEGLVHPPYLQIFLDTLWKEAKNKNEEQITIDEAVVQKVGNIGNVLESFLEEKVNEQHILNKVDVWKFLKLFVPETGIVRKKIKLSDYTALEAEKLKELVTYLVYWKILSRNDEGSYELAHDILVPVIQKINIKEIRGLPEQITIAGNPYRGLQSFDTSDNYRFYGRTEAIKAIQEKIRNHNLVIVVGNSGSGKSSLIKAGLFPLLQQEKDGYKILSIVRTGEQPLRSIDESLAEMKEATEGKFILLLDQYEELITRINDKETWPDVTQKIFRLLEAQREKRAGFELKIIITVRADFEPQFRMDKTLSAYWNAGKYLIPPFSLDEIKEVIEEPAYQAGLQFSPPSLVDTIAGEVYSSQSNGLLPLMSFTLSELYNALRTKRPKDRFLTEEDYIELGGVLGALQNKADHIYGKFKNEHPDDYDEYQQAMQNIMLRMVYLSTGELAGQRVFEEDLHFENEKSNKIAGEVLPKLVESNLIISKKDKQNRPYYEPAHDVLVKTWGQIWRWIGQIGKESFLLRSTLAQAVNDYYANNSDPEFLWHGNARLMIAIKDNARINWLNKKEIQFVELSRRKKEEAAENASKERDEKLRLVQEKFAEQQEKNKLIEEKVAEQKVTIRRIRKFRTVIAVALVFAALIGFFAFTQYRQANENYKNASYQKVQIQTLNEDLQQQNKLINAAQDSIIKLVESKTQLAEAEALAAEEAQRSAIKADAARKKALRLVAALDAENKRTQTAELLARLRGDSLRGVANAEIRARFLTDSVNKALVLKNIELDSINNLLTIQKSKNTSQLLAISKKLEEEDMVKAYRLAELAFKRDTVNKEAYYRYRSIAEKPAYYYTKELDGSYSVFSPDGTMILLYSSLNRTISLLESDSYRLISALTVNPGLISMSFSNDGKYLLLIYKNEVEKRKVSNLSDRNNKDIKEKNIYNASMYGDRILIQAEDGLHIWKKFLSEEIFTSGRSFKPDEKIISAFFSDDGKRVICNCEKGTVYIWSMENESKKAVVKDAKSTNVSPAGNYFLAGSTTDFSIYNSSGNRVDIPGFKKYGQLNSAIFSEDGYHVLLSFSSSSSQPSSGTRQKGDFLYSVTSYILLGLNNPKKDTINVSGLVKDDDILVSNDGISNVMIDGDHIIFKKPSGLVKLLKISNRQQEVLAGNNKAVKAISVSDNGSQILTSSIDNSTKIWKYSMPGSLAEMKLLPELTAADLKKYGVN